MRDADIENGLMAFIDESDPYKEIKQLQVKRWIHLYGNPLLGTAGEKGLNFVAKALFDKECWKEVDSLEQVKLDMYVVGRKLLTSKTENDEKSPLSDWERYKVACWCCFEEDIRVIFEEFKSQVGDEPVENLVKRLDGGALMIYWSHVMNGQEDQLKINYPDTSCHQYAHGFVGAILERRVEALEFFWNKLQLVDSVSYEQKEDLLMQTALYKGIYRSATVDMVDFCLRHLDPDKYPELLKRDFKQNGYYSTLYKLEDNYYFDSVQKLFLYVKPEDIPNEKYMLLVSNALEQISLAPNNNFIKAGYNMLNIMWNVQGFEEHKQYYLHELCNGVSRKSISTLTEKGEMPEILSQIVGSLNQQQVEYMKEVNEIGYIILSVRGLINKDIIDNLSKNDEASGSGDLEKSADLLEETNNVSVLGDVETKVDYLSDSLLHETI